MVPHREAKDPEGIGSSSVSTAIFPDIYSEEKPAYPYSGWNRAELRYARKMSRTSFIRVLVEVAPLTTPVGRPRITNIMKKASDPLIFKYLF